MVDTLEGSIFRVHLPLEETKNRCKCNNRDSSCVIFFYRMLCASLRQVSETSVLFSKNRRSSTPRISKCGCEFVRLVSTSRHRIGKYLRSPQSMSRPVHLAINDFTIELDMHQRIFYPNPIQHMGCRSTYVMFIFMMMKFLFLSLSLPVVTTVEKHRTVRKKRCGMSLHFQGSSCREIDIHDLVLESNMIAPSVLSSSSLLVLFL